MIDEPVVGQVSSKPRLGFLGLGWIGRHRLQSLVRSGKAEVGAVADPVYLPETDCPESTHLKIYSGLDDLLKLELDGIVIATPSALHAEQAIACLHEGYPVFCQKPLGRTAAETRRVVDAARESDRHLGVDFSYRYLEGMQKIREIIRSGEIGRVYAVDLVFHNAYGPDKEWYYNLRESGGGCLIDLGIHLVDLALWTMDFPRVTEATGRLFSGGNLLRCSNNCVEDYAVARLQTDEGMVINLSCSWRLPAGCDAVIGASFYGTGGGLCLRNTGGSFYDFLAEQLIGTTRRRLVDPPDPWWGQAAVAWAGELALDRSYRPEVDSLVQVAEVIDAVYADSGQQRRLSGGVQPARIQGV